MIGSPPRPGPYGKTFWIGVAVGWAVIGYGVLGVLDSVWLRDRPFELAVWVGGGLVVHDGLVAPLVTLVALVLAARLDDRWRGPVAAAAALTGMVLLFAYPLLRGFGRREVNPTILPLDYGRNVAVIVGVIWLGALVVVARRWSR